MMNQYDVTIYINKFLRFLKRENYSDETISGYRKDLKQFNQFIYQTYNGMIRMHQIHRDDLLDYLMSLQDAGFKQNSSSRHLSTLKSFYKYLTYELNFETNYAQMIRHKKAYVPLPDILDESEMNQLFTYIKSQSLFFYAFCSLLYYTGSRLRPIRTLPKSHLDLDKQVIYLERIKGGEDHYLPLNDTVVDILASFMKEHPSMASRYVFPSSRQPYKPVSGSTIRTKLTDWAEKAGIEKKVTPHIIRHCTATHLTLKGVDQKFIASILGHKDLRSTARYQQLNVDNLRPSLDLLNNEEDETKPGY